MIQEQRQLLRFQFDLVESIFVSLMSLDLYDQAEVKFYATIRHRSNPRASSAAVRANHILARTESGITVAGQPASVIGIGAGLFGGDQAVDGNDYGIHIIYGGTPVSVDVEIDITICKLDTFAPSARSFSDPLPQTDDPTDDVYVEPAPAASPTSGEPPSLLGDPKEILGDSAQLLGDPEAATIADVPFETDPIDDVFAEDEDEDLLFAPQDNEEPEPDMTSELLVDPQVDPMATSPTSTSDGFEPDDLDEPEQI